MTDKKSGKTRVRASRKSKIPDIFAGSEKVAEEQANLKILRQSQKDIENNIKNIIDTYNSKSTKDPEKFLDKLPLDSLKEFNEFSAGKKGESNLSMLKLRGKLRKDKEVQELELSKVNSQIELSQIDVLLAKIHHVLNKEE